MRWVSCHVDTDTKNGKQFFDRQKECDKVLTRCIGKEHKILKSVMVGSTYYVVVQTPKLDRIYEIRAAIFFDLVQSFINGQFCV